MAEVFWYTPGQTGFGPELARPNIGPSEEHRNRSLLACVLSSPRMGELFDVPTLASRFSQRLYCSLWHSEFTAVGGSATWPAASPALVAGRLDARIGRAMLGFMLRVNPPVIYSFCGPNPQIRSQRRPSHPQSDWGRCAGNDPLCCLLHSYLPFQSSARYREICCRWTALGVCAPDLATVLVEGQKGAFIRNGNLPYPGTPLPIHGNPPEPEND